MPRVRDSVADAMAVVKQAARKFIDLVDEFRANGVTVRAKSLMGIEFPETSLHFRLGEPEESEESDEL